MGVLSLGCAGWVGGSIMGEEVVGSGGWFGWGMWSLAMEGGGL